MPEQTLTAKLHIRPDKSQEALLVQTMEAYQEACSRVSCYIYETHDLCQKSLNRELYAVLRGDYGLRSQMAQSAVRSVIAAYKSMQSNGHPWTKARFRKGFYELVWNRDYSIKNGMFSINTLSGRLQVPFHREGHPDAFREGARFGSAKLIRKQGHFYLCVSYAAQVPEPLPVCHVAGVDLGINFLAVSYGSAGKCRFYPGKHCKQARLQYQETRRQLQRVKSPSSRRRMRLMGSRENRWMSDVNHQVSKALVEAHPAGTLFVLENLAGIRHATERVRKKDRYMQASWAFYDLAMKIRYKAERKGSQVLFVDPRNTSRMCPKCGHTEKANRDRKLHHFRCRACGYQSNDDRIAAMNLYAKGLHYLCTVSCG